MSQLFAVSKHVSSGFDKHTLIQVSVVFLLQKLRSRRGECIELYFEQREEGDNMLTKQNLQTMKEIENFFLE